MQRENSLVEGLSNGKIWVNSVHMLLLRKQVQLPYRGDIMTALTQENKANLHGFHAGRLIDSQCNNWIGELIDFRACLLLLLRVFISGIDELS